MRYEGRLFRPPSEANSIIIQATIGCAHNKCSFCSMYKDKSFRIRSLEEIKKDLRMAKEYFRLRSNKLFIADGDALIIPYDKLKEIIVYAKELMPGIDRVGIYGSPKSILQKSEDELISLRKLGLGIVYLGLESGNDLVLKEINKGVTAEELLKAGTMIKASGIALSVTLIAGLGGRHLWNEHALDSADLITKLNPDYTSFLTLMLEEDTQLYRDYREGKFEILDPIESLKELRAFIDRVDCEDTIFRSNHASNYLALKGNLRRDKIIILRQIDEAMKNGDLKPEYMRGL